MSDAEDDLDHDFAPDGSGDEAIGEDSDDEANPDTAALSEANILYLVYNRQHYRVAKKDGTKPGWQRCYNRTIKVATGKMLGHMIAGPEGWPHGEDLAALVSADKVVVVMGRLKKEDPILHPVWYLLVEVEDVTNKHDHQILRHIPKAIYKEVIDNIKKDPTMAESSLLRMQAHGENRQPLNPELNSFLKVIKGEEPKSAAVMPERPKAEAAKKRKADELKMEAGKLKKPSPASPTAPPAETDKKPKPSVMSLWKQAKPAAEEPASQPAGHVSDPAGQPAGQPAGLKRHADEIEGAAVQPMKPNAVSKKTCSSVSEDWDVELCGGSDVVFTAPPKASRAKVNLVWTFD